MRNMTSKEQSYLSIKNDFLRKYVEQKMGVTISRAVQSKNVTATKLCLERGRVPSQFVDVPIPAPRNQLFSVEFSTLVLALSLEKENLKASGMSLNQCGVTHITQEMVDFVDMVDVTKKIKEAILGTDRSQCLGKYLALYFDYEGISVHEKSFYAWSKQHPTLPVFNRNKLYNSEELEAWRHFLTTKPGRKPPHQYLRA